MWNLTWFSAAYSSCPVFWSMLACVNAAVTHGGSRLSAKVLMWQDSKWASCVCFVTWGAARQTPFFCLTGKELFPSKELIMQCCSGRAGCWTHVISFEKQPRRTIKKDAYSSTDMREFHARLLKPISWLGTALLYTNTCISEQHRVSHSTAPPGAVRGFGARSLP